ncbi:MAG: patatin-like phospholipase family protein, partial [Candidatus Polarisedimenticolia bacterium]
GLALALGAGGARGVAHAAVLRALHRAGIRPEILVGCSVGAIVAAMHAAVGLDAEGLLEGARLLTPGGLLYYALSRARLPWLSTVAHERAGGIPAFLRQLDAASFERLHHGIRRLAILTFDLRRFEEFLAVGGPGLPAPVPVAEAVKGSAAIPGLFLPLAARTTAGRRWLVDAGWHTAVPVERAFAPVVGADRVIAVDLSIHVCLRQGRRSYWDRLQEACGDRLVILRPAVRGCGTLFVRPADRDRLIEAGEEAVERALPRLRPLAAGASIRPVSVEGP